MSGDLHLVEKYSAGDRSGARFTVSGRAVRLEERPGGVVIWWPADAEFAASVQRLGKLGAESAIENVAVLANDQVRYPLPDAANLAAELGRLSGVQSVRLDFDHDSVVWEQPDDDGAYFAVLAEDWADARHILSQMGSEDLGSELANMVNALH